MTNGHIIFTPPPGTQDHARISSIEISEQTNNSLKGTIYTRSGGEQHWPCAEDLQKASASHRLLLRLREENPPCIDFMVPGDRLVPLKAVERLRNVGLIHSAPEVWHSNSPVQKRISGNFTDALQADPNKKWLSYASMGSGSSAAAVQFESGQQALSGVITFWSDNEKRGRNEYMLMWKRLNAAMREQFPQKEEGELPPFKFMPGLTSGIEMQDEDGNAMGGMKTFTISFKANDSSKTPSDMLTFLSHTGVASSASSQWALYDDMPPPACVRRARDSVRS